MLGVYEPETLEELYAQLKADGHQIWGKDDILDYAHPDSAWELLMIGEVMKARGYSDQEISEHLKYTPAPGADESEDDQESE